MNILGIGPLELVIIILILLLVLGPDDLEKTGKTVGKWINKLTKSEGWMAITTISREIRGLPARLAREAELDNLRDEFNFDTQIGSPPNFQIPTNNQTAGSEEPPSQPQAPEEEETSE